MNVQLLIDSIVRQTTVLIAQLATSGGLRAPLSQLAGQVFLSLARELEAQGVSRKVSADMFGMALRTYQRKTQRLRESQTDRGRSLWEAVFDYVSDKQMVLRHEVLTRFHRDDEALVRGVLHDLTESGVVFCSGAGARTAYRMASEDELGRLRKLSDETELDALIWTTVYREGPISRSALHAHCALRLEQLEAVLARLCAAGRVSEDVSGAEPVYASSELVIGLEEPTGWEGAVLDHFQALVRTICQKLAGEATARANDVIGGSTYTFVIWDGHPLEADVLGYLKSFRHAQSELRKRVDAHNAEHGLPARQKRVLVYGGQCVTDEESADASQENTDDER